MASEVILPKQGWSMDEARFVAWLKSAGQTVRAGEPLFSVETDKAVQEIEALDSGILQLRPNGPQEGDTIKIGDVIGYLLAPGESLAAAPGVRRGSPDRAVETTAGLPERSGDLRSAAVRGQETGPQHGGEGLTGDASAGMGEGVVPGARPVTPRAARRAVAAGVDLRAVRGSGAGGRIREADVIAAAGQAAAPAVGTGPAGRELPLRGLRRTIAERMVRSKTVTAPVTLTTRVDATALVKLRAEWKSRSPEVLPSYSDLIMKLVAEALREHPALNARWEETRIVQPATINIGLAVDTDDGLLVPVVRDVPSLTLRQLAQRTADLIARARQRRLTAEELTGGTFTITNLGALGVDAFTPIINHPECAVLGIGRIVRDPVVVGDAVVIQDRGWLSLTFDHRLVDGAPAARFLDTVRRAVESPAARLID